MNNPRPADRKPLYEDPDALRRLYVEQGHTQGELAEKFNTSRKTIRENLREFGIPTASPGRRRGAGVPLVRVDPHPVKGPYLRWDDAASGETLYVGQLLAIADGADPHEILGSRGRGTDVQVRFTNGRRDDLRPENIEVHTPGADPWRDPDRLARALEEYPTLQALADAWDADHSTITKWRDRFGLSRHYDPERGWVVERETSGESESESDGDGESDDPGGGEGESGDP